MTHYSGDTHVNVGFGSDVTILELAKLIARVVGFTGQISTDPSKPDGTPRKLLDSSKLTSLGWQPRIGLEEGLSATYQWFLAHARQPERVASIARASGLAARELLRRGSMSEERGSVTNLLPRTLIRMS